MPFEITAMLWLDERQELRDISAQMPRRARKKPLEGNKGFRPVTRSNIDDACHSITC